MPVGSFWERVYGVMKKNKITQKEAAKACHVSLRTFQNWKYRGLFPTIVDGFLLARYLGVTIEYLLSGREKKSKKDIEEVRSILKKADKILKETVL